MKKLLYISVLGLALAAGGANAHGPINFSEASSSGVGMMRYIEEGAIGGEAHEEMEALMEKMIAGKLTEEEAGKMGEFMRSNPGPFGMMMGRMGMRGGFGDSGKGATGGWGGMMGGYGSNAWAPGWFLWIHWISAILVWLFLALGIAALWKWLQKK